MRTVVALMLFCCGGVCTAACGADFQELFAEARAKRGAEYREAVTALLKRPDIKKEVATGVADAHASIDDKVMFHILDARLAYGNVFANLEKALHEAHSRLLKHGASADRSGWLEGTIEFFVRVRPAAVAGSPPPQDGQSTQTPSGAPVASPNPESVAAWLAVVEHVIKFLPTSSEYEQLEVVSALDRLTRERFAGVAGTSGIDTDSIYASIVADTAYRLSVRIAVAFYLPEKKRPALHDIMMEILRSDEVDNWHLHHRLVEDIAAAIVKEARTSDIAELRSLKCRAKWKQRMLSAALGIPVPPEAEAGDDLKSEDTKGIIVP